MIIIIQIQLNLSIHKLLEGHYHIFVTETIQLRFNNILDNQRTTIKFSFHLEEWTTILATYPRFIDIMLHLTKLPVKYYTIHMLWHRTMTVTATSGINDSMPHFLVQWRSSVYLSTSRPVIKKKQIPGNSRVVLKIV